ncbi:MAG TPA: SpoIIIAH-like family protein [Firmicutes bacterium]|nr:SpoIIIAH-like family protein [Bacillota bacterium]
MFIVVERWVTRTVLGVIILAILVTAFVLSNDGKPAPPPAGGDSHWTSTSTTGGPVAGRTVAGVAGGMSGAAPAPAGGSGVAVPGGMSESASERPASGSEVDPDQKGDNAGPGATSGQAGASGTAAFEASSPDSSEALPAGTTGSFFARYRLDRARTRSQQMELYNRMLSDSALGEEVREQAQQELMTLASQEEKETSAENLLRARGYRDALVILDQRGATVVIPDQVMTKEKAAQIGELVRRITGVPLDAISILPVGV